MTVNIEAANDVQVLRWVYVYVRLVRMCTLGVRMCTLGVRILVPNSEKNAFLISQLQ